MFAEHREGFLSGVCSPRELLESCIERIAALESTIHAFAAIDLTAARLAADAASQRWRAGRQRSPIDGMAVGIKDVFDTVDLPTEMGSPFHVGRRPDHDAAHVRALREAGAFVIAKTVTSQFAIFGAGPTRNPHDTARSPGATSAGSAAAVASGMLPLATGSQARGSIIRPASYCGVYGFKPTFGALNRAGTQTPAKSYDHLGAFARTVDDLWLATWEIAERAGGDPGFPGLLGMAVPPSSRPTRRIAMIESAGWDEASDGAKSALYEFFEQWRKQGVDIATRHSDQDVAAYETLIVEVPTQWRLVSLYESRWPMQSYRDRDASKLPPAIVRMLDDSLTITPAAYRTSLAWRRMLSEMHDRLGSRFDFLITLSAPDVAPLFPEAGSSAFNELASLIGVPALSVPALSINELPLGIQLIGFSGKDYSLLEFAKSIPTF